MYEGVVRKSRCRSAIYEIVFYNDLCYRTSKCQNAMQCKSEIEEILTNSNVSSVSFLSIPPRHVLSFQNFEGLLYKSIYNKTTRLYI